MPQPSFLPLLPRLLPGELRATESLQLVKDDQLVLRGLEGVRTSDRIRSLMVRAVPMAMTIAIAMVIAADMVMFMVWLWYDKD